MLVEVVVDAKRRERHAIERAFVLVAALKRRKQIAQSSKDLCGASLVSIETTTTTTTPNLGLSFVKQRSCARIVLLATQQARQSTLRNVDARI